MGFAADFGRADVPGTITRGMAPLRETQAIKAAGQVNDLNAIKLQEAKEAQARGNRYVDYMNSPLFQQMPEGTLKKAVALMGGRAAMQGRAKDVEANFAQRMQMNTDMFEQVQKQSTLEFDQQIFAAGKKLRDTAAGGDELATQKAQQAYDQLVKQKADVNGALMIGGEEAKRQAEILKQRGDQVNSQIGQRGDIQSGLLGDKLQTERDLTADKIASEEKQNTANYLSREKINQDKIDSDKALAGVEENTGANKRRNVNTAKDLAAAEEKIQQNSGNEAVLGQVNFFNTYSDTPYMYFGRTEPGKLYGTNFNVEKIDLPKFNGKQVTAADVMKTATDTGMSVDEVLIKLGAIEE